MNNMELGQPNLGAEFSHFVSLSIGEDDEQLKSIKKLQDKLVEIPGVGSKKNPSKFHITLMTLKVNPEEKEAVETSFKKVGEKFTEITGEGGFLVGFRGLEVGDGEHPPVFIKVELGLEILSILRGLLLDELHVLNTDPRFTPHVTLFGEYTLGPVRRNELFKKADQIPAPAISVKSMT